MATRHNQKQRNIKMSFIKAVKYFGQPSPGTSGINTHDKQQKKASDAFYVFG